MPPSGYTNDQSQSLKAFLKSCSVSLEREGLARGLSPSCALRLECENIEGILKASDSEVVTSTVLKLTQAFYERIAEGNPETFVEFRSRVDEYLNDFHNAVLAIHVPDLVAG